MAGIQPFAPLVDARFEPTAQMVVTAIADLGRHRPIQRHQGLTGLLPVDDFSDKAPRSRRAAAILATSPDSLCAPKSHSMP